MLAATPSEQLQSVAPTPFDWLDLVITFFTALAAAGAVAATFRLHKLSAGQVHVGLNASAFVPFSGTSMIQTNRKGGMTLSHNELPRIELAQVVVENPGRHGITITEVALRVKGMSKHRYRTYTPRLFSLTDHGGNDATNRIFFRLDPFDRSTVLLDIWSVIDTAFWRDDKPRKIKVRAEVKAAGHRRPFHSKGWWVFTESVRSMAEKPDTRWIGDVVLTELIRQGTTDLNRCTYYGEIATRVVRTQQDHASLDELKAIIGEAIGKESWTFDDSEHRPYPGMVAFNVKQQLEKSTIQWTEKRPPGSSPSGLLELG